MQNHIFFVLEAVVWALRVNSEDLFKCLLRFINVNYLQLFLKPYVDEILSHASFNPNLIDECLRKLTEWQLLSHSPIQKVRFANEYCSVLTLLCYANSNISELDLNGLGEHSLADTLLGKNALEYAIEHENLASIEALITNAATQQKSYPEFKQALEAYRKSDISTPGFPEQNDAEKLGEAVVKIGASLIFQNHPRVLEFLVRSTKIFIPDTFRRKTVKVLGSFYSYFSGKPPEETLKKIKNIPLNYILGVPTLSNFTAFFPYSFENLIDLRMSRLRMVFADMQSIFHRGSCLKNHAVKKCRFRFLLDSCIFLLQGTEGNGASVFLITLTSNNEMHDVIALTSQMNCSNSKGEKLDSLKMEFLHGKVSSLTIVTEIYTDVCEDVLFLYTGWNFRSLPRNPNFEHWGVRCRNKDCARCSALLTLLSIAAYKQFNAASTYLEQKPFHVDFRHATFDPENFEWLTKNLFTKFPKQVFQLKSKVTEVQIRINSIAYDPLSFSTRVLSKLQSIGLDFTVEMYHVIVDQTGWGLLKFRLNRDPITVKFSNGVKITWPYCSTKQSRIVCVETIRIPEEIVEKVCLAQKQPLVRASPVVYIDQKDHQHFDREVFVEIPSPVKLAEAIKAEKAPFNLRILSKHSNDIFWKDVPKQSVEVFPDKILYKSCSFSPVASIGSENENSLDFGQAVGSYLQRCVFVTVCSSRAYKMTFDCKKFTDDESRDQFKVSDFCKIRKVERMKQGDCIYAKIGGNLQIDERYGDYDFEENRRLIFHYPDPEHISNSQEYRMCKINDELDPEGSISYHLSTDTRMSEMKLFHFQMNLLTSKKNAFSNQDLDTATINTILDVCGAAWPELLRDMDIKPSTIAQIEHHHLGNVFMQIKGKYAHN